MVRSTVLLSGIVLALGLGRIVAATEPHLKYPRPCCPSNCPPGVGTYGYFPTTWRSWPCEERPEITNPRSIGAERLSTPQGREQVPLPQATPLAQPAPSVPRGGTLPTPGTAIPEPQAPGGPGMPGLPGGPATPPVEPKGEKPTTPLPEGGLPGLPVEPGPAQTPVLPKSSATVPTLDLNPPSQPSKETPKVGEAVPSQEKPQAKEPEKPQLKEPEKPPAKEPAKPQAKEAAKPDELPKLQDLTKPPSTEKASPGVRYQGTQPGGTAAASFEQPAEPRDAVPSARGSRPAPEKRDASAAHRAEAITVNMPEPSPNEIKATTYKMPEPAIKLEIIDHSAAERSVP
jgi:hypothetical protein